MTLLLEVECSGSVAVLSDHLLTKEAAVATKPTLPTINQATQGIAPERKRRRLCQKMVRISDDMFFCWAGEYHVAARFWKYMQDVMRLEGQSIGKLVSAAVDYPPENLKGITSILYYVQDGVGERSISGDSIKEFRDGFFTVRFFGSASNDIINWLRHNKEKNANMFNQLASNTHPEMRLAMMIATEATIAQSQHGFAIQADWGGGFELLYFDEIIKKASP